MEKVESFFDRHNKYLLAKRRNFILRLITIILLWSSLVVYFILPISKVGNITITGNVFMTEEMIIKTAGISVNNFRIDVNNKDVEKKLKSLENISNVSSKINVFSSSIKIQEVYPIGKNENRILWSDGKFTNYLNGTNIYGYIPQIDATISASFIEDFANANISWGNLLRNKKLLSIEDRAYPLVEGNSYSLCFEETFGEQIINIIFVVDKFSVTKKITLELYDQILNEFDPINIIDNTLIVGYIGNSYSYWRL